jgi:hypothetical protein
MRCKACDTILDDNELTRKDSNGDFFDLCNTCYSVSVASQWELDDYDNSGNISLESELTEGGLYGKI